MKNWAHSLDGETRSQTIERHTQRMFHDLRISWQTFGELVMEIYHQRVPEQARDIEFATGGDAFVRAKRNAQLLKRFLDPDATVRMPVDIEESWVLALAEPYRADCKRELAHRYGLLDVPLPDLEAAAPNVQSLAELTREYGGVLAAMAPILQAGVTHADLPHLRAAADHLEAVIASAEGVLALLQESRRRLGAA